MIVFVCRVAKRVHVHLFAFVWMEVFSPNGVSFGVDVIIIMPIAVADTFHRFLLLIHMHRQSAVSLLLISFFSVSAFEGAQDAVRGVASVLVSFLFKQTRFVDLPWFSMKVAPSVGSWCTVMHVSLRRPDACERDCCPHCHLIRVLVGSIENYGGPCADEAFSFHALPSE